MKRIGITLLAAPISSASQRAYDTIFTGNSMSSQVEPLDELFPATNDRAGRNSNVLFLDAALLGRRSRIAQPAMEAPSFVGCSTALS
jgi:hypothetical protein